MRLRSALDTDAGAIQQIWNVEIREGVSTFNSIEKTQDEVHALIRDHPDRWLVAEAGGQVIGFGTWSQFRGGVGYRHSFEHSVHVARAARGSGAGRALMARIEETVRQQGGHVLVAGISGENQAAVAFHERLGFQVVAQMPEVGQKFGRWMDLILMQKTL